MTGLHKKVRRRTVGVDPYVRRRLVVMLEPGDVISFREEGRRTWVTAPLAKVYRTVAAWNALARVAARKAARRRKP